MKSFRKFRRAPHSKPRSGSATAEAWLRGELTPAKKPRKKPVNRETPLHIAAADFCRAVLPDDCVFIHCPNGGARDGHEAAILKAMGVVAGVWDLLFFYRGRFFMIEMKPPKCPVTGASKGYLSQEQKDFREAMLRAGLAGHAVAYSVDDVDRALRSFDIPLKGALA